MKQDFQKDLARVLRHEGGKADHPKDPGGRTNRGVTQRVYSAWLRSQKLPPADVWKIPPAHVAAIYKAEYWDAVRGDALPTGVCYAVFDAAVNSGASRAILWLQLALGNTRADGRMGPATMKAVEDCRDDNALIGRMIDLRLNFVRHLGTYKTFGRGWESRYAQVRSVAQAEATGLEHVPMVAFVALGNGKANVEDAKKAPPTKEATTVAAASGTGGFGAQSLDKLSAFQGMPGVEKLIAALTLILFLAAGAAGAYLWWANRKRKRLEEALNVIPKALPPANDNALVDDGAEDEDTDAILHLAGTVSKEEAA